MEPSTAASTQAMMQQHSKKIDHDGSLPTSFLLLQESQAG